MSRYCKKANVAVCCERGIGGGGWRGFVCVARRPAWEEFDIGYAISRLGVRVYSCRLVLSREE